MCFFFGFFICLFVVLFGVLGRPEVQKISKSLWTSGLPSFRGERRRRRAHRGLQPCATLLELQLITVCRVHKQLAALRSVECPWGKLQGEMRLIQTSRVLKAWSPIQTSSSSDRLTHSSKHTRRESDGTACDREVCRLLLFCDRTTGIYAKKKKKRFYRRFGICVHTQVQDVPQEISGNSLKDFLQMLAPHLRTPSEPIQLVNDALPRPE